MKFTFHWLKDHLETEASLDALSDQLTSLGLVVDKIENKPATLAPFKICEIMEAEKHPNVVCDDVRFINEAKTLKENGWFLIKIEIDENLQRNRLTNKQIHRNHTNHT